MLIALQRFGGERPKQDARQLAPHEAQTARNCKLWSGTLRPWYRPRLEHPTVNPGPIYSIYRFGEGGYWLHWPGDVDVVRGPIAGSQRLYWTGDGVPKFGDEEAIAGRTTLVAVAPAGQNFLLVGNARGFGAGESITITTDSGAHTTTITTVQASLNRINLAVPMTSTASIGRSVANNDSGYPHGAYPMGVPAPTNVLTAEVTAAANSGTVTGLASHLGTVSGTTTTTAKTYYVDLVALDGAGELLEFQVDAAFYGKLASVQTKQIIIRVFREPAGANEKIYEDFMNATFQGPVVNASEPYPSAPDPGQSYWEWFALHPDSGSGLNQELSGPQANEAAKHPSFKYTPAAGAQTYRLIIEHTFEIAAGEQWTYNLQMSARKNAEVGIILNTTDHRLREGDKVQFGGIVGTGTLSDLNKGAVQVVRTDGATIYVDAQASGAYTSGGTWKQIWDAEDLEARSYVYTYVAKLGTVEMEGPPSLPSAILNAGDNQSVTVSGLIDPFTLADERPYFAMRVYRTSTGTDDTAPFLFVTELAIPSATFIDTKRGTQLGEVIPSTTWEPPPADLVGLRELPNGGLAGFRLATNELCLCEPYQPHAWPIAYRHSMLDTIVGIEAFGTSILAATKGRPTVVVGSDPSSMSEEHIEVVHPCLAKRGMVDMGYAILYPSETGLCYVAEGEASIITKELFSEDEWRALRPSSFIAAKFGDRYICFYDNGIEQAGFIIDPRDPLATLVFLDLHVNEVWSDPRTDKLYMVRVNSLGDEEIVEWNGDKTAVPISFRWRSKEFVSARPEAVRAIKVDADAYPVIVNLFADGKSYASVEVHSDRAERVSDRGGRARKWEVEVVGDTEVEAVYVASSMESLTRYFGG